MTEIKDAPGVKRFRLYNGDVELVFNPNSAKYRYTVSDNMTAVKDTPIRGVTSVLKDIIAKPDLMTWPMNMANAFYFGAKFDDTLKEYIHDWDSAAIKPSRDTNGDIVEPVTEQDLHEIMMEGSRQWTKRADQGKDIGTLVHSLVENYLKSSMEGAPRPEPVDQSEYSDEDKGKAMKAFESFKKWWSSLTNREVLAVERPVFSRSMAYAGTFDLLVRINDRVYLLDIKTTNASKKAPLGVYAEYFLQLGAYAHAIMEEGYGKIDDVGIVRVGKDGRLAIVTARDVGLTTEHCERAFAFAARLHDLLETTTPFLTDAHFKSHLIPSNVVEQLDSISN